MTCSGVPQRQNIMLVEDDLALARHMAIELEHLGYCAVHAPDGEAALALAQASNFDLMIVDRVLPKIDGISFIQKLREQDIRAPVLVLSSLGSVDERIYGLKAGGDDYLTKPFVFGELIARIEALLRRPRDARDTILRIGDLAMDLVDREVRRRGLLIDLLPREFKLLEYLMRRPNQIVTRAMLFEDVWHYRFTPQSNLVDVHIGKLRRKIEIAGAAPLIESVVGTGFLLRAPE